VLWREGDEAAFRELGGKGLIVWIAFLADGVLRAALQAVLANNYRPLLSGLEVLGEKQNPVCDYVREDVQHDFVTSPIVGLVCLAATRIGRQHFLLEPANDFLGKEVAIPLYRFFVFLQRARIELAHELGADVRTFD